MNRHHQADESVRCLLSHLCFGNQMMLYEEEGELLSTDTEEERRGDSASAFMMEINTLNGQNVLQKQLQRFTIHHFTHENCSAAPLTDQLFVW